MPNLVKLYVRYVDAFNLRVGRLAMYLIFPMGLILLYATFSRLALGMPVNWVLEMSQFMLSAYYLLGGAYAWQLNAHVRMDLFYDRLEARKRAGVDALTVLFVIFYLVILFMGGLSSTEYAITYNQKNYTSWAPVMWPIKVIMTFGIFLVLLQAVSSLFKDIAIARGRPIS